MYRSLFEPNVFKWIEDISSLEELLLSAGFTIEFLKISTSDFAPTPGEYGLCLKNFTCQDIIYYYLLYYTILIIKENFSKTLLLTKLLKLFFLQKSTPFPNTNSNFILWNMHNQNLKLFQHPAIYY